MSSNTLCYGNEPGAIRLWWYCARDAAGRRPLVLLYPTRSTLGECLIKSRVREREILIGPSQKTGRQP
jgi:hypothetical protein